MCVCFRNGFLYRVHPFLLAIAHLPPICFHENVVRGLFQPLNIGKARATSMESDPDTDSSVPTQTILVSWKDQLSFA